mmetsp:Transcript_70243/g.187061  ORF Transcript_70243/g.187061 Transcript_70243/m.187061 type:complete len:273 (-) Transcript_70243:3227-4045(-)
MQSSSFLPLCQQPLSLANGLQLHTAARSHQESVTKRRYVLVVPEALLPRVGALDKATTAVGLLTSITPGSTGDCPHDTLLGNFPNAFQCRLNQNVRSSQGPRFMQSRSNGVDITTEALYTQNLQFLLLKARQPNHLFPRLGKVAIRQAAGRCVVGVAPALDQLGHIGTCHPRSTRGGIPAEENQRRLPGSRRPRLLICRVYLHCTLHRTPAIFPELISPHSGSRKRRSIPVREDYDTYISGLHCHILPALKLQQIHNGHPCQLPMLNPLHSV